MTPCARGCCWTPMAGVCALNRTCACHFADGRPQHERDVPRPRDPTATQAIRNVMNPQRDRRKPR